MNIDFWHDHHIHAASHLNKNANGNDGLINRATHTNFVNYRQIKQIKFSILITSAYDALYATPEHFSEIPTSWWWSFVVIIIIMIFNNNCCDEKRSGDWCNFHTISKWMETHNNLSGVVVASALQLHDK
jgi:hypothetical protein